MTQIDDVSRLELFGYVGFEYGDPDLPTLHLSVSPAVVALCNGSRVWDDSGRAAVIRATAIDGEVIPTVTLEVVPFRMRARVAWRVLRGGR